MFELRQEKICQMFIRHPQSHPTQSKSASVADIDQQLYRKYGLSADEIAFIEKMIKPME